MHHSVDCDLHDSKSIHPQTGPIREEPENTDGQACLCREGEKRET